MSAINNQSEPYICMQTFDNNAHVIPESVFTAIINGEMQITDLEDYEMIVRKILREWLAVLAHRTARNN